jgi:radical SAM protein with 4Fe4S-binding SPASM domain
LQIERINEIIDKLSKYSTVTIQTNGIKYLKNLSKNLACIYVSLHGTKKYHERLQITHSWDDITKNIRRYIADGFEVNCDFTLTSTNYMNFEDIALQASKWGVYQYSINKFEPAGLGVKNFKQLAPTREQFSNVIDQIIRLQDKTDMLIGFCTAIPFCLDPRLPEYGLTANCGAGVSFISINPKGEVRICNQSNRSYGNIFEKDLLKIWNDKSINDFRDGSWVTKPCSGCFLFDQCLAGCKVDNSMCQNYCVDYAIRNLKKSPVTREEWNKKLKMYAKRMEKKQKKLLLDSEDKIYPDKFTKLYLYNSQKILITRHQTTELDDNSVILIKKLLDGDMTVGQVINFAQKKQILESATIKLLKTLIHMKAIYINQ